MGVMKRLQLEWILRGVAEVQRRREFRRSGDADSGIRCPIKGCAETRERWQVLCFPHWRNVPREIALEVNRLNRESPGSREHLAAIRRAIEAVEGQQESHSSHLAEEGGQLTLF